MSGTLQASVVKDGASATNNLAMDASGNVTVGNNLTVTGTTTHTGAVGATTFSGAVTAPSLIPSGSSIPTNGMYLSAANTVNIATNSTNQVAISSTGIVTGTAGNLMLVQVTSQASTSGTAITFTGIPSWAKRITVMFNGVSTNGASGVLAQLGSGSLTTSGYNTGAARFGASAFSGTNSTSGILINSVAANVTLYGNMIITNITGNVWTASYVFGAAGSGGGNYVFTGGGQVSLSGALDRVAAVTANGTDAFNAGSINILYE